MIIINLIYISLYEYKHIFAISILNNKDCNLIREQLHFNVDKAKRKLKRHHAQWLEKDLEYYITIPLQKSSNMDTPVNIRSYALLYAIVRDKNKE